jgi:hypothetical protein
MPTRLDRLLAETSPKRNRQAVAVYVDAAMTSFRDTAQHAETWQWAAIERYLVDFVRHMVNNVLQLPLPEEVPTAYYYGTCAYCLESEYGPHGKRVAMRIVRERIEGGLHFVLRAIARRMAADHVDYVARERIHQYWESLSEEEAAAAAQEYLEKYTYTFPSDLAGVLASGSCMLIGYIPRQRS